MEARGYLTLVLRSRRLHKPTRGDDLSQLGGGFVIDIDASGSLRQAHFSRDPADPPPVSDVLAALDATTSEPRPGLPLVGTTPITGRGECGHCHGSDGEKLPWVLARMKSTSGS